MSKTKIPNREKGKIFRLGTWNVNTIAKQGKIHNTIQEIKRMKLGVSKMRWPNSGTVDIEDYKIYYSDTQNGVGIIMHRNIAKSVRNCIKKNKYADKPVNEIVEMYETLSEIQSKLPKHKITILMRL